MGQADPIIWTSSLLSAGPPELLRSQIARLGAPHLDASDLLVAFLDLLATVTIIIATPSPCQLGPQDRSLECPKASQKRGHEEIPILRRHHLCLLFSDIGDITFREIRNNFTFILLSQ